MTDQMEPAKPAGAKYPIVEMRQLARPGRTGILGLGSRVRRDLTRPREGHYVLVYKVDDRYVVDNMSRNGRDDKVVRAAQVSVVDMRRHTPVEVQLTIPSGDHSNFTVVVTFACSVTDAVAVVQGGIVDPGSILLTYLKSHHGYSQMGLAFAIAQVNEARLFIDAQLTAYATVSEPVIDGMEVTMASVEVRTPEEVQARSAAQRSMRNRHTIDRERSDLETEMESVRQRNRHDLRMSGADQDQEFDYNERRYRRLKEQQEQEHANAARHLDLEADLARMGMTESYRRRQLRESAELLDDPMQALLNAYLSRQIDAGELAARMEAAQDRRRAIEQAVTDRQREEDRELRRLEREERREHMTHDRQMKTAEVAARRADEERRAEDNRVDKAIERSLDLHRLAWARQDELTARQADANREQRQHAAWVEMARKIVDRGLVDSFSDLEEILRLTGRALQPDEARAELPEQPPADKADDDEE